MAEKNRESKINLILMVIFVIFIIAFLAILGYGVFYKNANAIVISVIPAVPALIISIPLRIQIMRVRKRK